MVVISWWITVLSDSVSKTPTGSVPTGDQLQFQFTDIGVLTGAWELQSRWNRRALGLPLDGIAAELAFHQPEKGFWGVYFFGVFTRAELLIFSAA